MSLQIETSFLRLFFQFYTALGCSFIWIPTHSRYKIPLFIWNCLINTFILYCSLFGDPFLITFNATNYSGKPLLKVLDAFNGKVSIIIVHLLIRFYFHFNGLSIVRLLDSPLMRQVYTPWASSWRIFILVILIGHQYIIFALWAMLLAYIRLRHLLSWTQLLTGLYLYLQLPVALLPLGIFHYGHYGILSTLQDTVEKLSIRSTEETIERVQSCATFNRQLNNLLSFPFTVFFFGNTLNTLGK